MKHGRARYVVGLAMMLAFGVVGCAVDPPPGVSAGSVAVEPTVSATTRPESASPTATASSQEDVVAFVAVVDGDTVETSAGTVRIIGIDTPERGECGHDEASTAIEGLLSAGDLVTLELPDGQNDRDQHGRLLRFVITADGVDLGLMQLQEGNAIARYDSTDGYPEHPREDAYRSAQVASAGPDGAVVPLACQGEALESVAPFKGDADTDDPWWRQYPSCSRLKKNTVGHPTGPFRRDDPADAEVYDWFANGTGFRGDGDGDGLACE